MGKYAEYDYKKPKKIPTKAEIKEEYSTARNTEDFKQIEAVYFAYKAYLTHLTK